jgi:hypothetical protein
MRFVRKLIYLLIFLMVLSAVPAALMPIFCRGEATSSSLSRIRVLDAVPASASGADVAYLRDEARTYLTFPEWFIVYVSQDYGAFLEHNPPSGFPYFSAVTNFWTSYCGVTEVTTARYPMNWGAHVMIYVIGISHSFEYILKGIYENTLGRLFEELAFGAETQEDVFARQVAQNYGAFLNTTPWYEYPFGDTLSALWSETSLGGAGPLRKWERKLILSAEYGFKAGYGALIGGATGATYEPAALLILMVTGPIPEDFLAVERDIELIDRLDDGGLLIEVPRYAEFTRIIRELVDIGVEIREIAGNGEILVSALMPAGGSSTLNSAEQIFDMELANEQDRIRVGYRVLVPRLGDVVGEIGEAGGEFEHAYDY